LAILAAAIDRALEERARNGGAGSTSSRVIAGGDGWGVADVVCTSGPQDRPFEERHDAFAIAVVAAGTFHYRGDGGSELMTPGSLMLGSAGQCFECGHEHGAGDRCVSFWFEPEYFERIAADAGAHGRLPFRRLRVPAMRELSPLVAEACAGISGAKDVAWDELSVRLAAATIQAADDVTPRATPAPAAVRRVAAIVRAIERRPDEDLSLARMARAARLSPYHFLRTFEQVAGTTPHQFVMRTRLREAARRLATEDARVIDVALGCGFGDQSRFTHAFRAEFGTSPTAYRRTRGSR
jgi:AraC-like DNA-binding protein